MEEERKICPFLSVSPKDEALLECVKEECMFWDAEADECLLVLAAKAIIKALKGEDQ